MITEENRHNRAEEIKLLNLRTHRAAEHLLNVPINKDIPLRISCECGGHSCEALVVVPFFELENIRKNSTDSFIILPDHHDMDHFKITTRKSGYLVVVKNS
jgi:hypothetical protein